jgi:hypothetical protein
MSITQRKGRRSSVCSVERQPVYPVRFTKVNIGFILQLFDNERERLVSLCFGRESAGGGVYNR